MKTCTRVSIGLLLGIVLIVVSGDTAAQTADPSSGGRRGEFLGLSPSQAKELRRKLESTIRERAVLESVHTVEIRSEVAGSMTILRLVPEASVVKKGDLLVQLDGSSLQEEMLKQRAAVAQARAALRQIELANAVADQQRTNGVAVAKLAAKVAELDRNKYLAKGGEFELALKKIESEMAIAQQMLDLAQNAIKSAEQAVEKGMADRQAVVHPWIDRRAGQREWHILISRVGAAGVTGRGHVVDRHTRGGASSEFPIVDLDPCCSGVTPPRHDLGDGSA